ncbi:hypothetical protein Tco_1018281 [Tanacetum coccineum]|uniref:Uncharacterized protein n=1 Tax=Tanacetum coccineum TaxID=301880 RepID=A0ABQ5FTW6_9ASTR
MPTTYEGSVVTSQLPSAIIYESPPPIQFNFGPQRKICRQIQSPPPPKKNHHRCWWMHPMWTEFTRLRRSKVDNARCVGSIRVAAATWVPPSVASKDILTLFKATDLKTSVHGDFDYDVMAIDKNHCKAVTSDHAESSLTHLRYGHVVWFSSMCRFVFSNTAQTKRSVSNVLFHTKIYINENIPEIVAFKKR